MKRGKSIIQLLKENKNRVKRRQSSEERKASRTSKVASFAFRNNSAYLKGSKKKLYQVPTNHLLSSSKIPKSIFEGSMHSISQSNFVPKAEKTTKQRSVGRSKYNSPSTNKCVKVSNFSKKYLSPGETSTKEYSVVPYYRARGTPEYRRVNRSSSRSKETSKLTENSKMQVQEIKINHLNVPSSLTLDTG